MIFDWTDNCKRIIETKHFPNEESYEKSNMTLQHIVLFKYLEEIEHKSKKEIKDFWLLTDSPFLEELPQDDKDEWITVEFEKLWTMRNKNMINFSKSSNKVYDYPIFQEEIDYINSLDCDTWIRKALFLMLGCAKHNKNGLLKFNYTTTAWIEKTISPNHKIRDKVVKLGRVNSQYGLYSFVGRTTKKGLRSNWLKLHFMKKEGTVCQLVYSPNNLKDFLDLIKDKTNICPECGKEFTKSTKAQTNLCEDCYKIHRRQKKTTTMQNLRTKWKEKEEK